MPLISCASTSPHLSPCPGATKHPGTRARPLPYQGARGEVSAHSLTPVPDQELRSPMNRKTLALPAVIGLPAPLPAACGSEVGGAGGGNAIVVGTTDRFTATADAPAPFDPAHAHDTGICNALRQTVQTLTHIPRRGGRPVAGAASRCQSTGHHGTATSKELAALRDQLNAGGQSTAPSRAPSRPPSGPPRSAATTPSTDSPGSPTSPAPTTTSRRSSTPTTTTPPASNGRSTPRIRSSGSSAEAPPDPCCTRAVPPARSFEEIPEARFQ